MSIRGPISKRLCVSGAVNHRPRVKPTRSGGAGLANERWRVRFESEAGRRAEGAARRAGPGQVMAARGGIGGPGAEFGTPGGALRAQNHPDSPAMCSLRVSGGRSRRAGGLAAVFFLWVGVGAAGGAGGEGAEGTILGRPHTAGSGGDPDSLARPPRPGWKPLSPDFTQSLPA